ncbi:hypothetical protein PTSG_07393 [Salpingoeca rosetta]|uniref:Uncharacterized protein n=1 Tax=Salpingoeca rosetta (strain ATCC 50818 / BSB-021) TaxID=946362 RepID=F2UIK3_SALR5|nr:uncharacterized protein PTSG_07393 [Salpingoeca rosetta]EGD77052.1 hypothetical protein PTSG_07393 [Salpingoeca rosetta]|eukprot:XP_004990892.1 hypothetical protein PTSG_07393 [Salpingoeca rosetta]
MLGLDEWACVAAYLVPEPVQQPPPPTWASSSASRSRAGICQEDSQHLRSARSKDDVRALFNLMMTCRWLYAELPWTLPKWCLSEAYEGFGREHHEATMSMVVHTTWLDEFQLDLKTGAEEAEPRSAEARPMPRCPRAAGRVAAAAVPPRAFSTSSEAASTPLSCAFAKFGRIHFASLQALEEWCHGNAPAESSEEGQAQAQQAPQLQQQEEQQEQEGEHQQGTATCDNFNSRDERALQVEPDNNGARCARAETRGTSTDASNTLTDTAQSNTTHGAVVRPAEFNLCVRVATKEEAEQFAACVAALGEDARGGTLNVVVLQPVPALVLQCAQRIHHISVSSRGGTIDRLAFNEVHYLAWSMSRTQATLPIQRPPRRGIKLSGSEQLADISVLAGVPHVTLWSLPSVEDLSPLRDATSVALQAVGVTDLAPLARVTKLDVRQAQQLVLSETGQLTLHAHTFAMAVVSGIRGALHLPQAQSIELSDCYGVSQLTCRRRIRSLYVERCGRLTRLPDFERAGVVDVDTIADVGALRDLAHRVDNIVLRGVAGQEHMSALPDIIPAHVGLSVPGCKVDDLVRTGVAGRLTSVHAHVRGSCDAGHFSHARDIKFNLAGVVSNVVGLDRLPPLKRLSCHSINLNGDLSCCEDVALFLCKGEVNVSQAQVVLVSVEAPTLRLSSVQNVLLRAVQMCPLFTSIHFDNVHTCVVHRSHISDFSAFHGVHRLVLKACVFDSVDTLPLVPVLCMRDCARSDGRKWPDRTLCYRTRTELATLGEKLPARQFTVCLE